MADAPTFQIPRDVIEPILQAHVSAAIAQAFGSGDALVKKAIDSVVMMPVKEDGTRPSYNSDKTTPWLEWAVGDIVKKVVRSLIESELKNHESELRDILIKQLRSNNSPILRQMAEALVKGISSEQTLKWGINISVGCNVQSRY